MCHSADQAALTNCPKCHCVAYCSEDCRAEDEALHASVCSDLRHCITDYKWQVTKGQWKTFNNWFPLYTLKLTSVFSGDKLQCYLPPRRETTQQLNPEFQRVFIEDCDKLFADTDTQEYRQSQVMSLNVTIFSQICKIISRFAS